MKIESLIALSAAVLVLGGCNPRHQPVKAKEPNPSMTANQAAVDVVKTSAASALDAPANPQAELVALAGNELRELDAKIAELARRAEALEADARTQADQALSELRRRRDGVAGQIDALNQGSTESLRESRTRLASALSEMKRLYESAWLKFDEGEAAKPAGVPGEFNAPNRN
jgi:hypothetical protein